MAATYTKPTAIPRWADTGTRVEPAAGKKDIGWIFEEPPPYGWENWLQGVTGDWLKWVDERFDDADAGDSLMIVSPGAGTDALKIADLTHSHYEKVVITSGEALATAITTTGQGLGHGGYFQAGSDALAIGARGEHFTTGVGVHGQSGTGVGVSCHTGASAVRGALHLQSQTNAPSGPAPGDMWYRGNRIFAQAGGQPVQVTPTWARLQVISGTPSIVSNANVASVTVQAAGAYLEVAFDNAFGDGDYALIVGSMISTDWFFTGVAQTAGVCRIFGFNADDGSALDFDTDDSFLSFVAYGDSFA